MTEEKENCNFQQNYNVFGLDDKPCCYLYHKYCDEIEGCYFKRCKRLEQENNSLQAQLNNITVQSNNAITALEQENKELKEKNKNIKAHKDFLFKENDKLMRDNSIMRIALNEIKEVTTNALAKQRPYKEDFIDIQEIINKIAERQEKNKYRSALEEINILAKNYCNACDEFKAKTYKNKNDCLYCNYGFIKNKIKEVLNEN